VAGAISAVHCGQRRAATGMLVVHSGQSRLVATFPHMMKFLNPVMPTDLLAVGQ
jgi:hypothetical protein